MLHANSHRHHKSHEHITVAKALQQKSNYTHTPTHTFSPHDKTSDEKC